MTTTFDSDLGADPVLQRITVLGRLKLDYGLQIDKSLY